MKGAEHSNGTCLPLCRTEDAATGRLMVDTDCGRYTADRLVLTAGAWIGQLAEPLRVRHR